MSLGAELAQRRRQAQKSGSAARDAHAAVTLSIARLASEDDAIGPRLPNQREWLGSRQFSTAVADKVLSPIPDPWP